MDRENKMRKINLLIIALIMTLGVKVNALSATSTIECDAKKISVSDNLTCTMKTKIASGTLYATSADIKVNSNTEIVSTKCDTSWQGGVTNNKIGVYTANAIQNKTIDICTITIKSKGTTNKENIGFTLENVKYTDESYNTVNDTNTLKVDVPVTATTSNKTEGEGKDNAIKNPETGAFLPMFIIIIVGSLAFVTYNFTAKKNKFYKI